MHKLIKIKDNIYIFTPGKNDRPLFALIQGNQNSIIIDAGNSPLHSRLFLDSIKDIKLGKTYIVLTHWHWDHTFGSSTLSYPIISTALTSKTINLMKNMSWDKESILLRTNNKLEFNFCCNNLLKELKEPSADLIRLPDIVFCDSFCLNLDDTRKVNLIHIGGDHSPDSTIIHLPSEKIVFLGDCISPAIDMKSIYYTKSRFIPLLSNLINLKAEYYYESHSSEPILLKDIIYLKDYVTNIIKTKEVLYDNLNREYFPKEHKNILVNSILQCWDMFIDNI